MFDITSKAFLFLLEYLSTNHIVGMASVFLPGDSRWSTREEQENDDNEDKRTILTRRLEWVLERLPGLQTKCWQMLWNGWERLTCTLEQAVITLQSLREMVHQYPTVSEWKWFKSQCLPNIFSNFDLLHTTSTTAAPNHSSPRHDNHHEEEERNHFNMHLITGDHQLCLEVMTELWRCRGQQQQQQSLVA